MLITELVWMNTSNLCLFRIFFELGLCQFLGFFWLLYRLDVVDDYKTLGVNKGLCFGRFSSKLVQLTLEITVIVMPTN